MATKHVATSIAIYAPVGIPELLHSEGYVRALAAAGGQLPAAVQEMTVAAAMARQRAIRYVRPVNVTVVLAAAVLRQQPGDRTVLRDQLCHLAELAASHPPPYEQLTARNAKLRRANRILPPDLHLAAAQIQRLGIENARLREELQSTASITPIDQARRGPSRRQSQTAG